LGQVRKRSNFNFNAERKNSVPRRRRVRYDERAVGEPVQFETKGGNPLVLEVRTADGKLWEVRMVFAAAAVTHESAPNQADPAVPNFSVQLQVTSITTPKS